MIVKLSLHVIDIGGHIIVFPIFDFVFDGLLLLFIQAIPPLF